MQLADLPEELLDIICGMVLTVQHPVLIYCDKEKASVRIFPEPRHHWLSLLSTSRQLHGIATNVVFNTNRFILACKQGLEAVTLESFFNGSGSKVKHLRIGFPEAQGEKGGVILCDHSWKLLSLFREKYKTIATLELVVRRQTFKWIEPSSDVSLIREALACVNEEINTGFCSALVTIRPDHSLSKEIVEVLKGFSWTVGVSVP